MGRQTEFFALEADERMLLAEAYQMGAYCVAQHGRTFATLEEYAPDTRWGKVHLYIPGAGPLLWDKEGIHVAEMRSDVIELSRSTITPSGRLGAGRVYLPTHRLAEEDGLPVLQLHHPQILALYEHLHRFIRKRFYRGTGGSWSFFMGPAAFEWHQSGGVIVRGSAQLPTAWIPPR